VTVEVRDTIAYARGFEPKRGPYGKGLLFSSPHYNVQEDVHDVCDIWLPNIFRSSLLHKKKKKFVLTPRTIDRPSVA
jgi:hypothetical protein